MNKSEIFRKIKNALNDKEQLVLASMLDGDSVVETAKNCGISVQFAQSYRKTVYETVGEFVDFGNDKKQKQKILIDFMLGYELATSDEKKEPEETAPAEDEKEEISPAYQELFSHMVEQHNCTLLESEIQEIYRIVNADLIKENQTKAAKIDQLEYTNCDLLKKIEELEEIIQSKKSNFFVFNPYRDKPNKVYKSYDAAFKDASDVATKSQNAVFVLRIDTLVVPHCEIEAVDVTGSGIPEKYLQEEIPF